MVQDLTAFKEKITRVFDAVLNGAAFLSGILIVLMMLGVSADVLLRYFFNKPISGLIALAEIGMLYAAFLAAPWLLRIEAHVKMDFLTDRINPRRRAFLIAFGSLLGAAVSLVFIFYGTEVTLDLWRKGEYDLFKIKGFPKAISTAIIPTSSVLLLIQFARRGYSSFKAILNRRGSERTKF